MINILIVGAGGIGERHLRCFQKVGVGQVGVVEANEERREWIASRYGCPSFADLKEARRRNLADQRCCLAFAVDDGIRRIRATGPTKNSVPPDFSDTPAAYIQRSPGNGD